MREFESSPGHQFSLFFSKIPLLFEVISSWFTRAVDAVQVRQVWLSRQHIELEPAHASTHNCPMSSSRIADIDNVEQV